MGSRGTYISGTLLPAYTHVGIFLFSFLFLFSPCFGSVPNRPSGQEPPPVVLELHLDEDGEGLTSLAPWIMFSIFLSCIDLLSELRLWDGGRGGRREGLCCCCFFPILPFFPFLDTLGFLWERAGYKVGRISQLDSDYFFLSPSPTSFSSNSLV